MCIRDRAKWAGYGVLLPVSRKVQTAEKYLFSVLGLLAGILINLIFNLVGGTNTGDFLDVLPVILICLLYTSRSWKIWLWQTTRANATAWDSVFRRNGKSITKRCSGRSVSYTHLYIYDAGGKSFLLHEYRCKHRLSHKGL